MVNYVMADTLPVSRTLRVTVREVAVMPGPFQPRVAVEPVERPRALAVPATLDSSAEADPKLKGDAAR
jgi:hypothetical protein